MSRKALTPDEHPAMTAILAPGGSRALDGLVRQGLSERGFVRADVEGFVLTLAGHRLYLTTLVDSWANSAAASASTCPSPSP